MISLAERTLLAIGVSVDGSIEIYQARVSRAVSIGGHKAALKTLKPSPKFLDGRPLDYPGLTLLTPPGWDDFNAFKLYETLDSITQSLLGTISGRHIRVSPDNYHVTIADILSGHQYRRVALKPEQIDTRVLELVTDVWQKTPTPSVLDWRPAGLAFFEHALVCLLAPRQPSDYHPLIQFRETLYSHETARALEMEHPRPFMAHITLSYFSALPALDERENWLLPTANAQAQLLEQNHHLNIATLELRRFDNMTRFIPIQTDALFCLGRGNCA